LMDMNKGGAPSRQTPRVKQENGRNRKGRCRQSLRRQNVDSGAGLGDTR